MTLFKRSRSAHGTGQQGQPRLKIAFDGGAFQQGISGGIFNVAVGLLNAAADIDPNFSYVLVADPRFGPVRPDALARLNRRPKIVYAEVSPAFERSSTGLTTGDPRVRFEIDGRIVTPTITPEALIYEGPPPRRSLRILSRAARPADTLGVPDPRNLGIAIQGLTFWDSKGGHPVSIFDPLIQHGFHDSEGTYRWTNGSAELPAQCFETRDESIRLEVRVVHRMAYRLLDGAFDAVHAKLDGVNRHTEAALALKKLENKLIKLGASIYLVNHFIPARVRQVKMAAILHDVIPTIFPALFMADAQLNFSYNLSAFRRAAHVFSNSESSRNDLIRLENVPPERVTDVGIDIDRHFAPAPPAAVSAVRLKRGVADKPYIICVGTLEPRKNHATLVRAFDRAFRPRGFPIDLVIVGKHGWGYDSFSRAVDELHLHSVVRVLSDVGNDELVALYSGALFCAYPSLYEGFGLPVLEAMACGCPVLTSDVSSLPEIAQDAAIYVDPNDVASIARGLTLLADDPGFRATLAERGLRNRKRYDWTMTARRVLDRLYMIAGDRPQ